MDSQKTPSKPASLSTSSAQGPAYESAYDEFVRLADDKRLVLLAKNNVLLLPFESVLTLLDTSFEEVWGRLRRENPRLPVVKTMVKLRTAPTSLISRRTFLHLEAGRPDKQAMRSLLSELTQLDYWWPTAADWLSFFGSNFFTQPEARSFLMDFTREVMQLNGEAIPSAKALRAKWLAYVESPAVARFGCPAARPMLSRRLSELRDDALLERDPVIHQAISADLISVLMRLAAWVVADLAVRHWDAMVRDGMADKVPLQSLLPAFDPATGDWSSPMVSAIEALATKAGWAKKEKAITYLGTVWAESDNCKEVDPSSCIRLLRDWVRLDKGRPKFESLLALTRAAISKEVRLAGISQNDHEYFSWTHAMVLRFAETLFRLRPDLTRKGYSVALITGIMGVYSEEYRFARQYLGKPMGA